MLAGENGPGTELAMTVVTAMAAQMGAARLLDITSAHVDSCLFHGIAGLDFAQRLLRGDARTTVPTTLNVGSLDLLHPDLYRGSVEIAALSRQLMNAYLALGCEPTWTCAPYQLLRRPSFGEQVAWAESNATVFVNSVLGARSNRYGDFLDICCAVTGRAPAIGLHLDEGRGADLVIKIADGLAVGDDWFYPLLGCVVGEAAGSQIPVLVGLPFGLSEDRLKALGASAATTGSVALFHAVGSTPEAPDLESVTNHKSLPVITIDQSDIDRVRAMLTTGSGQAPDAVSLGAPHYSVDELESVSQMLAGREVRIPTFINTGRDVIARHPEVVDRLRAAGLIIVTDTCTYLTPILDPTVTVVMTDSGKWAYYAPGNIGVGVIFASTADCVETAVSGG